MADINVEMLKEKLYPAAKALFIIGETLVDESKQHISAEDAIKKIQIQKEMNEEAERRQEEEGDLYDPYNDEVSDEDLTALYEEIEG